MEQPEKVRQISKTEAKEIDPSQVAYFTLNDGTVIIVKDNINQEKSDQIQNTIQTQSQNTQEVQLDSNMAYNISSEGENLHQISGAHMNGKLISATYIGQNQIQGQRRQLYKLIEAIPVRFCDVQGMHFMNQSNNIQLNLQQYNNDTYIVERSNRDVSSNYQINTQSSGKFCSCGGRIERQCCCPIGNPALREEMEIVNPEDVKK